MRYCITKRKDRPLAHEITVSATAASLTPASREQHRRRAAPVLDQKRA
jgi:hypothetical protein